MVSKTTLEIVQITDKQKISEIFLRRKDKLILNRRNSELPSVYLATALKNLESLGYTFSVEVLSILETYTVEEFTIFYKYLVKILKNKIGAHVEYSPMYPNFPKQVMEASACELYINAIMHYLGDVIGLRITPNYEKAERLPLLDRTDLKVIYLGSGKEFHKIFYNLMLSKTSISLSDKNDLAEYIRIYNGNILLPSEFNYKEISSFVFGEMLKYDIPVEVIQPHFQTATDVLRLATVLSDGDESLATNTEYISFSRRIRRLLLKLLDESKGNLLEDMNRYKVKWVRLGEKIHPSEYSSKYPKICEAFDKIRNSHTIKTFNSDVEAYIRLKEVEKLVLLLKTRAGIFARRLDLVIRIANDKQYVIDNFGEVADQVTTPTLLQLISHFENRDNQDDLRIFFPKGNVSKVYAIPNNLGNIDYEWCYKVTKICEKTLVDRFSKEKSLKNVYISSKLNNYLVPFSQRSASKSLRTIVRGSKLPIPSKNTIRFFLWWKDVDDTYDGRVDIDLTAIILDSNWQYISHVSYTNLRNSILNICHSGDITSAPSGACEFIDIDIEKTLQHRGRYVIMSLHSYSQQPYYDLPECFAGWMSREYPDSGEIFDPKTVQDKIDLTSKTKISIPVILDLKDRTVTWADLSLTSNPSYNNNLESNYSSIALISKAILSINKPTLYTLFNLHVKARGILVDERSEADTIFSVNEGITPFDIETIIAEYLK